MRLYLLFAEQVIEQHPAVLYRGQAIYFDATLRRVELKLVDVIGADWRNCDAPGGVLD
jgi:hypothetical protein